MQREAQNRGLIRIATSLVCLLGGALALWLIFHYLWGVVLPFLLAFILSRALRAPVGAFCRKGKINRRLASASVVLLAVGGVSSALVMGARRGVRELRGLITSLSDGGGASGAGEALLARLEESLSRLPFLRDNEELTASLGNLLRDGLDRLIAWASRRLPEAAMSAAGQLPGAMVFLTVLLLSAYYFTADDGALSRGTLALSRRFLSPTAADRLPVIGRRFARLGREYGRACLVLGGVCFLLVFIGLTLLRVPYAFLFALFIAVVDFLPLLGTGVVLIPFAGISLLLGDPGRALGLLILYGVCTLSRQLLEPRLMGRGLGLHPLVSLMVMYAGLRVFGLGGMLILPLVAGLIAGFLRDTEENSSSLTPLTSPARVQKNF